MMDNFAEYRVAIANDCRKEISALACVIELREPYAFTARLNGHFDHLRTQPGARQAAPLQPCQTEDPQALASRAT